jgi:hypothetical protein
VTYKTNISTFLPNGPQTPLLESYRILVAIELALKDRGFNAGTTGHDIPAMLAQTAIQHPTLASQLNAHQAKLHSDLIQLTCNDKNNQPIFVRANNYPHARYTRFVGDWGGVRETSFQAIEALAQTCNSLLGHLQTHKTTLGIQI